MKNNSKKKILVVKLGAIGDVVMSLAMINEIEIKYPEARITWIAGKTVEPLINSIPRIDEAIIVNDSDLLAGNSVKKLIVLFKIWIKLFGKRYDLILTPYKDKRYKLLTLTALSKVKKDFVGKVRQTTLIHGRYHALEYMRLINETDDWQMRAATFPECNIIPSQDLEGEFSQTLTLTKRVVLAPGGSRNLLNDTDVRRWPTENYVKVTKELIKHEVTVLIVGSESDSWVSKYFEDIPVVNLIGKTSITDVVFIYNNCNLLITHDTGLLHLAKLSGIYTIALFGPVDPQWRVGINENIKTLWGGENLNCAPCYDGKNFAECNNNICMKNINPESVMDLAIKSL
jgi:heptosyltransferase-2